MCAHVCMHVREYQVLPPSDLSGHLPSVQVDQDVLYTTIQCTYRAFSVQVNQVTLQTHCTLSFSLSSITWMSMFVCACRYVSPAILCSLVRAPSIFHSELNFLSMRLTLSPCTYGVVLGDNTERRPQRTARVDIALKHARIRGVLSGLLLTHRERTPPPVNKESVCMYDPRRGENHTQMRESEQETQRQRVRRAGCRLGAQSEPQQ